MKSYKTKFNSLVENCESFAKVANFHTNPYNFAVCLPNPNKLSILGAIWRAANLPFPTSEYFYSWLRLSKLVDLSFEYFSFSNRRKTTILFPSSLTFLQLPMCTWSDISWKRTMCWPTGFARFWRYFFFIEDFELYLFILINKKV